MLLKIFILGVFIRNGTTGILFSFSSRRQEFRETENSLQSKMINKKGKGCGKGRINGNKAKTNS